MPIYLKLDGIPGEVELDGFERSIDVLSWEWSLEQPRLIARPNRATPARAEFNGLDFVHEFDKSSPKLMLAVANGTIFPEATLHVLAQPDGEEENEAYLVITLHKVRVARLDVTADSDLRPVESLTLNFVGVKVEYFMQTEDGTLEKENEFVWNVRTNKAEL